MSIHGRNWRSAEWEAVVCQYKVYTGDQANGRMLYVNTNYTLEISRTGGCCMSIQIIIIIIIINFIYTLFPEKKLCSRVFTTGTLYTGDQPNGRMLYVNTKYKLEISRTGGCCMSIHSRHWRSAEREVVVCRYTVETGDQPNGRLFYVNTQ